MVAQRQQLMAREFTFSPSTLEEAQKYAGIIANSGMCPENFRGRPNDVLIVLQLGAELGLKPMQALRSLGAINGMPFAYGDGQLALVKRHKDFENMKEWFEGDIKSGTLTAFCTMYRKNSEPVTQHFSMDDAKLAGLWAKKGVWQLYPARMLQHRARGFAARDAFPDALFGLMSEEEAYSVAESNTVVEVVQPIGKGMAGLKEALNIAPEPEIIEVEIEATPEETTVSEPTKLDELKELITRLKVTKGAVTVTLKKNGVSTMEELSSEMIDKWIDHLKSKEQKND